MLRCRGRGLRTVSQLISNVFEDAQLRAGRSQIVKEVDSSCQYYLYSTVGNGTSEKSDIKDSMCWRCGQTPEDIFLCGACGTIQPPCHSVDAYGVFGLKEARFDVDLEYLESKYKSLQKSLHPDKFSSATPEEQEISSEQAMHVNHAYATLKNPLSRATYLLSLHGCAPSENQEKETITDFDMLEAIMEFREEVEQATDEAALLELKRTVQGKIDTCISQMKHSFEEHDFGKALKETQTLRYLHRMYEAVEEKL